MKLALILATLFSFISSSALANNLFSLENLERERAALLSTQFDTSLSLAERQQKEQTIYRRLVDIERMVMRDDRITASSSRLAKAAFDQYELTFLVHSSAEKSLPPVAHWMSELNMNSASVLSAKSGQR